MKNYSLIIWDFNGTLLDDVGAALGSVNDMLARRSKEPITLDENKICQGSFFALFCQKKTWRKRKIYVIIDGQG